MPITITGGKYALQTLAAAGTTTVTIGTATFVAGDFAVPRIVGLWSAANVFKGFAYIRRFLSTTALELENLIFDPATGAIVTQVVGDQILVSKNYADIVTTGLAISGNRVNLTDSITFGNNTALGVCFHDQAKNIETTVGNINMSGGLIVHGHLDDYATQTNSGICNLFYSGGQFAHVIAGTLSNFENFAWYGGSIIPANTPTYLGGDQRLAYTCIYSEVITGCDLVTSKTVTNTIANPTRFQLKNIRSVISGTSSIGIRWGIGSQQGCSVRIPNFATAPISAIGDDSAGNYVIDGFTYLDAGDGNPLWRSNTNEVQNLTIKNYIGTTYGMVTDVGPNPNGTSLYQYTGTYSNLQVGSVGVVTLNATGAVVDSIASSGTTWLATVLRKQYTGTTETFTRGPWTYAFKKYGFDAVGGSITPSTVNLGSSGIADNVIFGGPVNQLAQPKVTLSQAAAAALTSIATVDNFFDASFNWATLSVTNAVYPTPLTYFFAPSGLIMDMGSRQLVIDSTAASAIAVNTGTNVITVKSSNFAKGSNFNTVQAALISIGAATSVSANLIGTVNTSSALASGCAVTGNVNQATPTNMTGVTITGNLTYNTNTNTTITLTNCTITGTVSNGGTGTVTVRRSNSNIGTVGTNVVSQLVTSLTITNLTAGSSIYVANGSGVQQAYVASSGTTYTLDTTGSTGTWTWKVARYGFVAQTGTHSPASASTSVVVSLVADAFITQATTATVAAYTTLQNPDRMYDYAAYWETTNAGIALARIVSKQGANASFGAYDVTLNASGSAWSVSGNRVTMNTTANFAAGSTMTGGLITTGNATVNAQATTAGSYAPILAGTITLAGLVNYQNLSATGGITGLPTTGTISAGGAIDFGASTTIASTGDLTLSGTQLAGSLTVSTAAARNVFLSNDTGSFTLQKTGVGTVLAVLQGTTARGVLQTSLPTGVTVTKQVNFSGLDPSSLGTTWVLGWITTANYNARTPNTAPSTWAGWTQASGTGNTTMRSLEPLTEYQIFLRIAGYYAPIGPIAVLDTATQSQIALSPIVDVDLTGALLWPQTAAHTTQAARFAYNVPADLIEYTNTTGSTDYITFLAAYRALETIVKEPGMAYDLIQPVYLNGTKNGFSLPRSNPLIARMSSSSTAGAILQADISYDDNQSPAFDRFRANSAHTYLLIPQATATISTSAITSTANASAVAVRTELATELARMDIAVSAVAPQVMSSAVEAGVTLQQSLRLQSAVLLGKVSGAGTGTETFRDVNDTKNRVVATVDANGNRTSIIKDAS